MTIQASAQPTPIVPVNIGLPVGVTDSQEKVYLRGTAAIALQQLHDFVVNMNRSIPCNASITSNVITLTMLPSQPNVLQYASYDSYVAVMPSNSTGTLTALVETENGSLGTVKVFRNATTQAGSGDIVANGLYEFIFNDALDGGNGGLLLHGIGGTVITKLTNSTGGSVSNTIGPVSGSGDDTDINNNFASLTAKVDAIMTALGLA